MNEKNWIYGVSAGKIGYAVFAVAAIVVMIILGERAWMAFVVVATIVMVMLGIRQYVEIEKSHVVQDIDRQILAAVAIAAAIIFGVLLYCTQGERIIAWYEQTGPSADLSVALALAITLIASVALGVVLYFIGVVTGLARAGYLYTRQQYVPYVRMDYKVQYGPAPQCERFRKERTRHGRQ